jgi:hypothetical protein
LHHNIKIEMRLQNKSVVYLLLFVESSFLCIERSAPGRAAGGL